MKMARRSFVQIGGKLYERGVDDIPEQVAGWDGVGAGSYAILGDLPDFVSPIDGSVVRGRAGMREHCKKHDVVPTAELKGLPVGRPQYQPDRAAIREQLVKQYYK
jgi:hypothetical protein